MKRTCRSPPNEFFSVYRKSKKKAFSFLIGPETCQSSELNRICGEKEHLKMPHEENQQSDLFSHFLHSGTLSVNTCLVNSFRNHPYSPKLNVLVAKAIPISEDSALECLRKILEGKKHQWKMYFLGFLYNLLSSTGFSSAPSWLHIATGNSNAVIRDLGIPFWM